MSDMFVTMLEAQLELQRRHMKDGDPRHLDGEAMADFMRWNAFALEDEIHEAMQEVGWKPWATSREINVTEFMREMVDGYHFYMNMLLCATGMECGDLAEMFFRMYMEKNAENARRQIEGYTGLEKCQECGREVGHCDHIR
jgi:hypothetical protein